MTTTKTIVVREVKMTGSKPQLRVCLAALPGFFEATEDGKRITGVLKEYLSFYFINQFKHYNATMINTLGIGAPISIDDDGLIMYDGCYGSNQRNETDYSIGGVPYPLYGQNLSNGVIFASDIEIILSLYNPEQNKTDPITILSSFNSPVPLDMKIACIMFLGLFFALFYNFFLSGIFSMKRHMRKRRSAEAALISINIILGCLIRQYSCFEAKLKNKRKIIRPLLFLLIIFTFIIMHFLCSLVKTDQVIIQDPGTIQTYEDIVKGDGKITPKFVKATSDYAMFERAKEGTMKRKIWDLVMKQDGGLEASFVGGKVHAVTEFIVMIQKVANQEAVILLTGSQRQTIDTNACILIRMQGMKHNILTSVDPKESKFVFKTTGRRSIPDSEGDVNKLKKADDMMTRFFQMGFNDKNSDLMGFTLIPEHDVNQYRGKARDCLANEIVRQKPEFVAKGVKEFFSLLMCFIVEIVMWFGVLVIEIIVKRHYLTFSRDFLCKSLWKLRQSFP